MLQEENLDEDSLLDALHELYFNRDTFIENMGKSHQYNSIDTIIGIIQEYA